MIPEEVEAADFTAMLRPKAVAAALGVSTDTLRRLVARDATFPVFVQVSPKVRYVLRRDLNIWLARRRLDALERRDRGHRA